MNDLTTTNNRPIAKTVSDECSPVLWRRLTECNFSFNEAVDRLAADPVSRGELEAVNAQLQRHAEPCGSKAVIALLTPLVTLYGVSDKSEGEWKAFWGFYVETLKDVPLEALRAGVAEYVGDGKSEFFPKPGPLKEICLRHAVPIYMATSRARRALLVPADEAVRRVR